jgi:hypothetical protein
MKRLEKTSTINDIAALTASVTAPITPATQQPGQVSSRINAVTPPANPWTLPSILQYPGPPRGDEFNISEGMGTVTLQPVIDALNNFKVSCINSIKTKREAIGPETTKDVNLSVGAVELITQVLQAAKSYTQAIRDINNLINSYISAIDRATVAIANQISIITHQIAQLKAIITTAPQFATYLISIGMSTWIDRLSNATGIFDILSLVIELEAELMQFENEVHTLSQSYNRIGRHLRADILNLKNRLYALEHISGLRDMLSSNRKTAQNSYMTDDYLLDFNTNPYNSLSYDWSLTNSSGLTEYSLIDDEHNLIEKLNAMFQSYDVNTSAPVIIDSRQDNGQIVVPTGGILLAGLDPLATPNVTMYLELIIDNGSTIITTKASGDKPTNSNDLLVTNIGKYINRGDREINYSQCIKRDSNTYELVLVEGSAIPLEGDLYVFSTPGSSRKISFTLTYDTISPAVTGVTTEMPLPFQVLSTTHNSVILWRWDQATLLSNNYFLDISNMTNISYLEDCVIDLPDPSEGTYVNASSINNDYILADSTNSVLYLNSVAMTSATSLPDFMNESITRYTPKAWNDYVATITNPSDPNYNKYIYYAVLSVLTLTIYSFNSVSDIPHVGDKITCKNWVLQCYVSGDKKIINEMRFSHQNTHDTAFIFFMKAHWGFIPA